MSFLNAIDRGIVAIGDVCLFLAVAIALFMAVYGAADVVTTFVLHSPLPITRELSSELLPVLIFAALPRATRDSRHIMVDILVGKAPVAIKRLSAFVALLVGCGTFILLASRATKLALESYAMGEFAAAIIRFPVWPIKGLVAIAMWATVAEIIRMLARREFHVEAANSVTREVV